MGHQLVLCIKMVHKGGAKMASVFAPPAFYQALRKPRFALSGTLVAKTDSKNLLFHANVTGKHHEKTVDRTGRGRLSVHTTAGKG
jgi:hypothetical protein